MGEEEGWVSLLDVRNDGSQLRFRSVLCNADEPVSFGGIQYSDVVLMK
jgi:hypothetical protein